MVVYKLTSSETRTPVSDPREPAQKSGQKARAHSRARAAAVRAEEADPAERCGLSTGRAKTGGGEPETEGFVGFSGR